jgi:hypothetical protein
MEEAEREAFGSRRYRLFKSVFLLSLRSKDFKYEEYLRSLFGKLVFRLHIIYI